MAYNEVLCATQFPSLVPFGQHHPDTFSGLDLTLLSNAAQTHKLQNKTGTYNANSKASCQKALQNDKPWRRWLYSVSRYSLSGADQLIIQHCSISYSQYCSWKHLWEFYRYLLTSLLSCNEDLCAGHVLLLQGYLFPYWLKIKMVIYASILDHCNVLFHWFCGSSLHAFNSLCETLTARSFQTSHSQFCSLQLPTTPNH